MNEILVDSHLYEYDEEDKNITRVVDEKDYEVVLEKYYIEVKQDESYYHQKMMESGLFIYVNDNYEKKDDVSETDVLNFYKEMMGEALKREYILFKTIFSLLRECKFKMQYKV